MASGHSPLTRRFLLVNRGDTNNRNGYRIINKRVVHYSGPWEVNFPGGVLPAASNWLLIKDLPPTGAIGIVGVLETETRLGSVHARHAARQPEVQHSVRPLIAKHQLHAGRMLHEVIVLKSLVATRCWWSETSGKSQKKYNDNYLNLSHLDEVHNGWKEDCQTLLGTVNQYQTFSFNFWIYTSQPLAFVYWHQAVLCTF